jgi:hypothetical protein
MSESGQMPTAELGGVTGSELNEESMKILEEASALLEVKTKSKFPDLPFSDPDIAESSNKKTQSSPSSSSAY